MGDRANVAILQYSFMDLEKNQEPPAIVIYFHWSGSELPGMLQSALKATQTRWIDEPYATRILIDQLTKGGRDEETGYGVSLGICDNDRYPILVVDFPSASVRTISEADASAGKFTYSPAFKEFTFNDYIQLDLTTNAWKQLGDTSHG